MDNLIEEIENITIDDCDGSGDTDGKASCSSVIHSNISDGGRQLNIFREYECFYFISTVNVFSLLNVTTLMLYVYVNDKTFDQIFELLPNLEYFGYMFMMNYSEYSALNRNIFKIKEDNKIKHLEITVSDYDFNYSIDYAALYGFIKQLKSLVSLRMEANSYRALSRLLIENRCSFRDLYLNYDNYFYFTECLIHYDIPTKFVKPSFENNVYKNLYIQVCAREIEKWHRCEEYLPGIRDIHYPSDREQTIERQSKWFIMDNRIFHATYRRNL